MMRAGALLPFLSHFDQFRSPFPFFSVLWTFPSPVVPSSWSQVFWLHIFEGGSHGCVFLPFFVFLFLCPIFWMEIGVARAWFDGFVLFFSSSSIQIDPCSSSSKKKRGDFVAYWGEIYVWMMGVPLCQNVFRCVFFFPFYDIGCDLFPCVISKPFA